MSHPHSAVELQKHIIKILATSPINECEMIHIYRALGSKMIASTKKDKLIARIVKRVAHRNGTYWHLKVQYFQEVDTSVLLPQEVYEMYWNLQVMQKMYGMHTVIESFNNLHLENIDVMMN